MKNVLVGLSAVALAAVVLVGCGSPCSSYCSAARDCAANTQASSCSDSDLDQVVAACEDACEAGVDAVADADRSNFETCLECLGNVLADKCELDSATLAACSEECGTVGQASLEAFSETSNEQLSNAELPACVESSDASCQFDSSSANGTSSCEISCGSSYAAQCTGPDTGPVDCTCTSGPRAGDSFSAGDCNALDGAAADLCAG